MATFSRMPRYDIRNDGAGPYAIFYCDSCGREFRSQPDIANSVKQDVGRSALGGFLRNIPLVGSAVADNVVEDPRYSYKMSQAQLDKATQDFNNLLAGSYDVLYSAYVKANDAANVQLQPMFNSVGTEASPGYQLTFPCDCSVNIVKATQLRADAQVALDRWRQEISGVTSINSPEAWQKALDNAVGYLQTVRDLMATMSDILSSPFIVLDMTKLESYKAAVSAGAAENSAALTSVNGQSQAIAAQKIVVQQYASQLALKKAGSTTQDIAAQRAAVAAAQAQADQIQALINKNIIRSPIAGTVTRVDAKVGQSASPNVALISVISASDLEITANVPEVDVGKIAVGNKIDFTVDALPGDSFTASVSYIDPAETIIDGVVNFKMKAALPPVEGRLKSGLTVNLSIRTQYKPDALILPQFAIIQNDNGTFVEKITGKTTVQIPVVLGLRSADGIVEVISGVNEGDRVANVGLK